MPVDTSIYQMLGHGVTPIKTPQEMDLQNQQMRQMKAQTGMLETQQLGLAQTQVEAQAMQKAAQEVAANANANGRAPFPAEFVAAYRALGTPNAIKAAHEAQQAITAQTTAEREATLAQLKVEDAHNDAANRVIGGIQALPPEQKAADWPRALADLAAIDPNKAKAVAEKYPQYPGDQIVESMFQHTLSTKERNVMTAQAQLQAHQAAQLALTGELGRERNRIAEIQAKKPNAAFIFQQQGIQPGQTDQQILAGLDQGQLARARNIAAWEDLPATKSTRTPDADKVNAAAAYLAKTEYGHPEGLPGRADVADVVAGRKDYGPAGGSGKTITASATATRHLSYLEGLGTALQNNDTIAANRFKQLIAKETGKAAPTNYAGASALIVPEVLKAAKTAGVIGEKEEERLLAANSNVSSPAQMQGFINTMAHLMGDRLISMQTNYAKYNRGGSIAERLDPEARTLMAKYGITLPPVGSKVSSNAPTIPPPVTTAVKTATLADGSQVQLSADGKSWEPVK